MSELADKILEKVKANRENHFQFLLDLIKTETTDMNEANGQKLVLERLQKLPCTIDMFEPDEAKLKKYKEYNPGHVFEGRENIVATFSGTGGGKSLLLNGHIDTVFPTAPETWITDPWTPLIKDNRLYGLGACDMKAGLAAQILALEVLNELGVEFKGDVIFQSVVDEEAGGGNGTLACIDRGYVADAALVAEPSELLPMSAHNGSVNFAIEFTGRSCHTNMKWEGVNAIDKALGVYNDLQALAEKWAREQKNPMLHPPVLSINVIDGGMGAAIVPNFCRMEGNFTYQYGFENSVKEFTDTIEKNAEKDPWLQENPPKLEWVHHVRPYYTEPDHDWPQMVADTAGEIMGEKYKPRAFPTGTDARLIANISNIPTVILGPGSIKQAHTVDEFVDIEEFHNAIAIFANIIANWSS